jgi:predicted Zn-dependent protease
MREVAVPLVCAFIPGCSTVSPTARNAAHEFVEVTRTEFAPQEEYYMGRVLAAKILSVYEPYLNDKSTHYVNLVGQTLVIHSPRPETYGGYHFLILDSIELNSVSAPGGFIFITRGLLRLATNEDMVGCILAYSISHAVLGSGLETIRESRLQDAYSALAIAALQDAGNTESRRAGPTTRERAAASKTLALSALSERQVLDADRMAVSIASRAGYNPTALRDVLVRLSRESNPRRSPTDSTFHPLRKESQRSKVNWHQHRLRGRTRRLLPPDKIALLKPWAGSRQHQKERAGL